MKKLAILPLLATLVAPIGARANHCTHYPIVVFSYTAGNNTPNIGALCAIDDGHTVPVDYRSINPTSDGVSVRYIGDLGMPSGVAYLDGLGFNHKELALTRGESLGLVLYDSDVVAIPDGSTGQGCLTVTIKVAEDEFGNVEYDQNNYHTIAASCPDYP